MLVLYQTSGVWREIPYFFLRSIRKVGLLINTLVGTKKGICFGLPSCAQGVSSINMGLCRQTSSCDQGPWWHRVSQMLALTLKPGLQQEFCCTCYSRTSGLQKAVLSFSRGPWAASVGTGRVSAHYTPPGSAVLSVALPWCPLLSGCGRRAKGDGLGRKISGHEASFFFPS